MNKYRKALENLKQRINVKANMPIVEEAIKATEILEAKNFWVVIDGRNGKHFVFRAEPLSTLNITSLLVKGANLVVDISGIETPADDCFPLNRLFLTEEEAEKKADELNKGEKR